MPEPKQVSPLPVSLEERSTILDALRGFALIGVLTDNIVAFSGWAFLREHQQQALSTWPADGLLGFLELTFIHGKFYSILSLLFGIGFAIQLARNRQRGVNGLGIFYRRLFILMIFGALHLVIWDGDILLLYALVGLVLPLFLKCKDRTLLIWAVAMILAPLLIDVLRVIFNFNPGAFLFKQAAIIDKSNNLPTDDSITQYIYTSEDGWSRWRKWMEPGFFYRYGDLLHQNRPFKVLGMFLFGLYAGRKLMYLHLQDHVNLFKKIRKWGLIVGIPAAFATTYFFLDRRDVSNKWGLADTFFYTISVAPLCLAYVSWFCLQWVKTNGNTKWKWLVPMGRMTLTNYLMQTIICIVLFYGLGFGVGGDIGLVFVFPIAFAIYVVQVLFSTWWLKHFNFGPFEWLWRSLTYFKIIPLKRRSKVSTA